MIFLCLSFFITALLYATAGFGGGSTYNALLVLLDTDYRLVPFISLTCNILVVISGVYHFLREGHVDIRRVFPWTYSSIPAAFIGGMIPITEKLFIIVMSISLFFSGVRMLLPYNSNRCPPFPEKYYRMLPSVLGAILGLLAGVTGIGGGIFLAPVLYFIGWGHAKQISGACSCFIFLNSLAGLIGQCIKSGDSDIFLHIYSYWPLLPAVVIGGQIGGWIGASYISKIAVKNVTAILVLYVASRLLIKTWG